MYNYAIIKYITNMEIILAISYLSSLQKQVTPTLINTILYRDTELAKLTTDSFKKLE